MNKAVNRGPLEPRSDLRRVRTADARIVARLRTDLRCETVSSNVVRSDSARTRQSAHPTPSPTHCTASAPRSIYIYSPICTFFFNFNTLLHTLERVRVSQSEIFCDRNARWRSRPPIFGTLHKMCVVTAPPSAGQAPRSPPASASTQQPCWPPLNCEHHGPFRRTHRCE